MKLSRTASYALQATLQLAQTGCGAPIPSSRLAANGGMPERFLLQILRNLVAHGVLESSRGVDGGYALRSAPDAVTLLDVIEAVEGPMVASLPVAERMQPESRRRVEGLLSEITQEARRRLSAIRLLDILPSGAAIEAGGVRAIPGPLTRKHPRPRDLARQV